MKELLKNILRLIICELARLTMWRYRPGVIGVTGSVGKTSTKRAIHAVLQGERRVRASFGNFNNEIGLPLTILGSWENTKGIFFWPKVLISACYQLIVRNRNYPEILVLEYGVDRPGDMKYLLDIARPNIGVITAIGEVPVHVEFFSSPDALAREKARLIEYLPTAGFAILNNDDGTVMDLKNRTRAHVMTFGFGKQAEVRISNFETRSEKDRPVGISFKLEYIGTFVPIRLEGVFGKAQAYAAAAGAAIGLAFGINLVKIAEGLKNYHSLEGRTQLLSGVKSTFVLDDSYNASPLSMHAALDTLKDLPGKRKIAVLGDMRELGTFSLEAHEYLGTIAAKVLDLLVTVGPHGKLIADGAQKKGMKKGSIRSFDTVEEASAEIGGFLKKGDVILVKGSRAVGLEKVVNSLKAET